MQSHYTTTTTDETGRAGRIRTVVGFRLQFCRLTPSTARPLHDETGASPPNRTASSCSSDRRADHLRKRGDCFWHPATESNRHREFWKLSCCHYTSGAFALWWASLESNQECFPRGTGVTARWCTRHSTKTPNVCWSGWLGSNQRPPRPKRGALPAAPHPEWKRVRESNPLSPAYETGMMVRFTPPLYACRR